MTPTIPLRFCATGSQNKLLSTNKAHDDKARGEEKDAYEWRLLHNLDDIFIAIRQTLGYAPIVRLTMYFYVRAKNIFLVRRLAL